MERIGPYRIVAELGRGGMGAVYQAVGPEGREVALKLLHAGGASSSRARRRFENEIAALRRISHPHVVRLIDAGEHLGAPYLAMEWIPGESLAQRIARDGPLAGREVIALGRVLAAALEACHAEGVLHRDLAPANVLLRAGSGQPLLTDFGLAKDLGADDPASTSARTLEGGVLGTPHFAPPEQLRGDVSAIGPRSDLWGLGAILYAALTGQPPREAETPAELFAAADRPIEPPSSRSRAIPPGLEQVIVRCLAPRIDDRYPSAAALREDLDALLAGRPLAARPAPLARSPAPAAPARILAALVVLAGGVGAAIVALAARRSTEPVVIGSLPGAVGTPAAPLTALSEPAPARRADPVAARNATERAREAWTRGDPALAQEELAQVLAADPDCAPALVLQAELLLSLADLSRALESVSRALEVEESAFAFALRAHVHVARGDAADALADLDRAIELEPRVASTRAARANVRIGRHDLDGTIEDATIGLELDPGNATLWAQLGWARAARGELEEGLVPLGRALELRPGHAYSLASRADVHRWRGDLDAAAADAELAVSRAPDGGYPWAARADVRLARGDVQGALADTVRALEVDPRDGFMHAVRADARRAAGDLRGALESANEALRLHPLEPRSRLARALAFRALGEEKAARADLLELERALPPRSPLRALFAQR